MRSSTFINLIFIFSAIIVPAWAQSAVPPVDEADALFYEATKLYGAGNYEAATGTLKKYIRLKPGDASAFNNLGVAFSDSGLYSEAVVNFKEALRLKPDYAEAYRNLGAAYYHSGRTEEAAAEFRKAIRFKTDYILAYNDLGAALVKLKQPRKAVSVLERAVRLNPQNALTFHNLGYAFFQAGNYKKAVQALKRSLSINPAFGESSFYLAAVYLADNDRAAGIEEYSRLKTLDQELAGKLYQALFKDKLLLVEGK